MSDNFLYQPYSASATAAAATLPDRKVTPVGGTFDDFVSGAANAVTMGQANRLSAYVGSKLTGKSYDDELARNVALSRAAEERSPNAALAGELAGSFLGLPLGGEYLAGKLGAEALGAGRAAIARRLLARTAGYGAEGAVQGGLQGAGETYGGSWDDYLKNAGQGALYGAAFGGAIGGAAGSAGELMDDYRRAYGLAPKLQTMPRDRMTRLLAG